MHKLLSYFCHKFKLALQWPSKEEKFKKKGKWRDLKNLGKIANQKKKQKKKNQKQKQKQV